MARDCVETTISDIVLAVDEPLQATRCNPNSAEGCRADKGRCITHDLWQELGNHIYLFLNSVSLEDVVEKRVLGKSGVLYRASEAGENVPAIPSEASRSDAIGTSLPADIPIAAASLLPRDN